MRALRDRGYTEASTRRLHVDCRMCGWHGLVDEGQERCPRCLATRAPSLPVDLARILGALNVRSILTQEAQLVLPLIFKDGQPSLIADRLNVSKGGW